MAWHILLTSLDTLASLLIIIIQYTIDQLVGASADELSTVIYWHCAAIPIMYLLPGLLYCFDLHVDLVIFIVSGVHTKNWCVN